MNRREVERAAQDIVERARAGDQVAMGLMIQVRKRAGKGDPRAKLSMRAMKAYVDKNPPVSVGKEVNGTTNPLAPVAVKALWVNPTVEVIITALPITGFWQGVVALVHGPRLDKDRLNDISEHMPEDHRSSFKIGVMNSSKTMLGTNGWLMGRIIGLARCIQRLQIPSVPISTFCPATAWELGE